MTNQPDKPEPYKLQMVPPGRILSASSAMSQAIFKADLISGRAVLVNSEDHEREVAIAQRGDLPHKEEPAAAQDNLNAFKRRAAKTATGAS